MCGITGWVDYDREMSRESSVILAMTRTLALRGPDGEGLWVDGPAAFGHRRLAVIDRAGGVQPMLATVNEQPLAVIAYNGEIYNFRELRQVLERRGHKFRTTSDTEVALYAYVEWGADFVDRLNGMYAIAIWDLRSQELVLARDRLGIKPLYYAQTPTGVIFGSEPKAVLANPQFRARIDQEGLAEVLTSMRTPGFGVFAGLREVRPGHLVRVSRTGCAEQRYWGLTAHEHVDDVAKTVANVRELLEDIVPRQLVADVPVCTLLSGGLDSSALTALAARRHTGPIRSYAVGLPDDGRAFVADVLRAADDKPFAARMAEHVGARHTCVTPSPDQLSAPETTDAVLRARDMPTWGDIDNSLYLLFRELRAEATVAMTGEAADELFGGYMWFHDPEVVAVETFPWLARAVPHRLPGWLIDPIFVEQVALEHIASRYREAVAEVPQLPGESSTEHRMRELSYLFLTRILPSMLDRKDRLSMAAGVEVRVPFCDHRLVDYVFNVPWSMKTYDGREKSLLRGAVRDLLPKSVTWRAKAPYPATRSLSYEGVVRERMAELAHDAGAPIRPFLDIAATRGALARPVGEGGGPLERLAFERMLGVNDWLVRYRPEFV